MNINFLLVIIFYGLIILFLYKHKKNVEIQNKIFVLYKTKLGLKLMDKISSKLKRLLNFLGYISVGIGFIGMGFISFYLLKGTLHLLLKPTSTPMLAPVLPGIKLPGLPVLSFWHWIIAILFVAVVHEFCHGVYARLKNIKIKSSGFALLGPILAAFVEPDEKVLSKRKVKDQMFVFSAGPFANLIFAGVFLLIGMLVINPIILTTTDFSGVKIVSVQEGYPANLSGIKVGEEILEINNKTINTIQNFTEALANLTPGQIVTIKTNSSTYIVNATKHPKNPNKGYLGISVTPLNITLKEKFKKFEFLKYFLFWISELVFWLWVINLGVGLFNLLPLGPIDGGRMFFALISSFVRKKEKAKKIFAFVTALFLFLIFINLLPYLIKLLIFLAKPITILFS